MQRAQKILRYLAILLFLNTLGSTHAKKKHICPIGYQLTYTKIKNEPICYRRKGPERFQDMFKDCAGNLYTSKLYHNLNINESDITLWTEYRSLYSGGPFVDWSYGESTGNILVTTYDVKYNPAIGIDEDLCVVIDPAKNFTASSCLDMHHRYCFVKPYSDLDDMKITGCEDTKGYWRFYSPRPACLTAVMGIGGGRVRATWSQAQELCKKRSGSLLSKGWRYSNNPYLHLSGTPSPPTFPLGVVYSSELGGKLMYDTTEDKGEVPLSEWKSLTDDIIDVSNGSNYGALRDTYWGFVNNSYIFYDMICERPIQLPDVNMEVTVGLDGKIVLVIDRIIDEDKIYCFTDSVIYYPTSIKISKEMTNVFILKPIADGYYWCTHVDTKHYQVAESNKALFLREKQSVADQYVVQIWVDKSYRFDNLEKIYQSWESKLKEYIFFRSKYEQAYGPIEETNASTVERLLQEFKGSRVGLNWRESAVIYQMKIKKLYVDGRTALLHVALNPKLKAVAPGIWDGLHLKYMKPAYYCPGFDSVPTMTLGQSMASAGCRNHSCVGDYNDGVQWVTTAIEGCSLRPPSLKTDRDVQVEDITVVMPTAIVLEVTESTNSQSSEETKSPKRPISSTTLAQSTNSQSSEETKPPERPISSTTLAPLTTEYNTGTTLEPFSTTTESVQTVTSPTEAVVVEPTTERVVEAPTTIVYTTEPTLPPSEKVQQVIEDLEALLQDDSSPVMVDEMNNACDQVDSILGFGADLQIPGELLHLLEELGARVDLNGSSTAIAVRDNIALVIAAPEEGGPVHGLRIAARDYDEFTEDAFEVLTNSSSTLNTSQSEAVVRLPASVAAAARRVSFVVFRTDRAFANTHNASYTINSRVLSVSVDNLTTFQPGEVIDIHMRPISEYSGRNESRACVFWQFTDSGGYWSRQGCSLVRSTTPGQLDSCRCTHLTHFAEILIPRTGFSETHEDALEILSIVGLTLSLFGLLMVALTAVVFRSWRRDYTNKIWLQLCLSIFLLAICFLIVVFSKFEEYNIGCMLTGVVMHYSVLASFCWMLVAAVLSYRRLVIIFMRDASHKLLKASAFSWGAPCAVVGVLLSVDPHAYAGRFGEKNPSGAFCYPSGLALWLTVYTPIAVMLLVNWILFALIVRSVFASRRVQRHGDKNEAVRCASVSCLLVFLFGLPWIFGLFAFNIVAAYFFTITTTMQGFILFIFFVVGNKKTRDLWFNLLKIKQTRKVPVTSSTYTNRSTDNRAAVGNAVTTIESKSSKPRSLSLADDSRFC